MRRRSLLYVNRFPEEYRATAKQVPFAPIKPPFEAVVPVGGGRWLMEKNGLALDSLRGLQLVDMEGLVRRIVVRSRGNVLGFDGTHLLMAEQFPDGVRLLRFVVPRRGGTGSDGTSDCRRPRRHLSAIVARPCVRRTRVGGSRFSSYSAG